jgi:hypothetical protein
MRQILRTSLLPHHVVVCAFILAGCIVDESPRCGDHQVVDSNGYCKCAAGFVANATMGRCDPCGANEEARGGKCECVMGWSRPTGGACMQIPTGSPCDTKSMPCTDPAYPVCHPLTASGTAGYCTKTGCTMASDCNMGNACVTKVTPSYCRRPTTGQGKACTSAKDCMGTEATYCEAFMLKQCLVENCSVSDPDACFPGSTCCDLTKLGLPKTLCIPTGTCP